MSHPYRHAPSQVDDDDEARRWAASVRARRAPLVVVLGGLLGIGVLACAGIARARKPIVSRSPAPQQCPLARVNFQNEDGSIAMGYACTNHLAPSDGVVGIWDRCYDKLVVRDKHLVTETVCVPWQP